MRHIAPTICFSGAAISFALLLACASPVEGLWPPSPDSADQTIVVSLDTWHAMIAFPTDMPDASRLTRMRSGAMQSVLGIWRGKRA